MSKQETNNLYFIASNGEYRLLCENVTWDGAYKAILGFLQAHNFKHYYTRTWSNEWGVMFDVGSHTEFFLWGKKE